MVPFFGILCETKAAPAHLESKLRRHSMKITELLLAELDARPLEFARHWNASRKERTTGSHTRSRCRSAIWRR